MAAMSISARTPKVFLDQLRRDFPELTFKSGKQDHWSPKTDTITYKSGVAIKEMQYGILHELAHAQLDHNDYHNDFELLKLETQAWELAAKIGRKYGIKIDDEHIQDCLDTYRDWLHARSRCPTCGMNVLQTDPYHYRCFNCQTQWSVTNGRFVRPYRRILTKAKTA